LDHCRGFNQHFGGFLSSSGGRVGIWFVFVFTSRGGVSRELGVGVGLPCPYRELGVMKNFIIHHLLPFTNPIPDDS